MDTDPKSDIVISIRSPHVRNIERRIKNHEFRKYLLPAQVRRMWIYETSPVSAITRIATISHGKRRGEVRDPTGLRNDEFDKGDVNDVKFAYEILKLEKLEQPITLAQLKREGWLKGPPQKYCFVRGPMRRALREMETSLMFDTTAPSSLAPEGP